MPHAVRPRDVACFVDQNIVGQTGLFNVPADGLGLLGDDGDQTNPTIPIRLNVACQFAEPASTIRSPGATMKGEQDRAPFEIFRQRAHGSFLVG